MTLPDDLPQDYRMDFEWPASQLTRNQMRDLRALSADVKQPITKLLKDAVDVFLAEVRRELRSLDMIAEDSPPPDDTQG